MESTLRRTAYIDQGTFGQFTLDDFEAVSLELPCANCIPVGVYVCVLEYSPRFKRHYYELKDVPGRSEILIHSGNTIKDTEGCILLGSKRIGNTIIDSRKTIELLHKYTEGSPFTLEVL